MNVIIVHGCPSDAERARNDETRTYDKHWIPWIRKNLSDKKIKVIAPLMPEPWKPDYSRWKNEFDKLDINNESVLVGHSCGCAFLVRWLGDTDKKVNKLILVAPWKFAEKENEKDFYEHEISENVKKNVEKTIIFTSDNEEEDGKRSVKIFHETLGGEVIELTNRGHFTSGDMGSEEFPELLDKILE